MRCGAGIASPFDFFMRSPRWLLWLVFVLASLLFWTVVFAYGWQPGQFYHGMKEELSRIFDWLARALEQTGSRSG